MSTTHIFIDKKPDESLASFGAMLVGVLDAIGEVLGEVEVELLTPSEYWAECLPRCEAPTEAATSQTRLAVLRLNCNNVLGEMVINKATEVMGQYGH